VILPNKFVIPAEAGIQGFLSYGSLLSQGQRLDSRSPIDTFEDKFHACALKRYGAQARE